ncbi:MAG: hypothetical protein QOJ32_393 [Frankiaceae bacterium]|nr:hypothetical protein [Frankiaceae bacterium]
MSLAPRAVLISRRTELDELLARHGTRGQAAFFLRTRGRTLDEVEQRHEAQQQALATVSAGVPADWRRGQLDRDDVSRFLFAPDDVVVVVGQDGLVANTAKYLDGQPVVGVDPEPARNPGVLVPHRPDAVAGLLPAVVEGGRPVELRTMVEVTTDDGQQLRALNEIYVGSPAHQTARYELHAPGAAAEQQASSGVLVGTGTGATGWCRSAWLERHSAVRLPGPVEPELAWFVREAWPSPSTRTTCTEGVCGPGQALELLVRSDRLVAFGDGIEADALTLSWGQSVRIAASAQHLRLVR